MVMVVEEVSCICFGDKSGRRGQVETQRAHPDMLSHMHHKHRPQESVALFNTD